VKILKKYNVSYLFCTKCHSLQTEYPYWLGESYEANISISDVGSAERILRNRAVVFSLVRLFRINTILDFGGGDGLLCRLLRDTSINAFSTDKFAVPVYARPFLGDPSRAYDLITAFEVLEHMDNPSKDIDKLFSRRPPFILVTTTLYRGEMEGWWYIGPDTGQHVFFYSEYAISMIARQYGYSVIIRGEYILF
jgi:hypothetical protein